MRIIWTSPFTMNWICFQAVNSSMQSLRWIWHPSLFPSKSVKKSRQEIWARCLKTTVEWFRYFIISKEIPYSSLECVSIVQESPGGKPQRSVQQAGSQHSHDLRLWQSRHWQQASSWTFMYPDTKGIFTDPPHKLNFWSLFAGGRRRVDRLCLWICHDVKIFISIGTTEWYKSFTIRYHTFALVNGCRVLF